MLILRGGCDEEGFAFNSSPRQSNVLMKLQSVPSHESQLEVRLYGGQECFLRNGRCHFWGPEARGWNDALPAAA